MKTPSPSEVLIILLFIIPSIFYLKALSNALKKCSPQNRMMAPEKVWLLLVPGFNLFWLFFVTTKIATSLKNEYNTRRIDSKSDMGNVVGILFGVCGLINIIIMGMHQANAYLFWLTIILWITHWVKISNFTRKLSSIPVEQNTITIDNNVYSQISKIDTEVTIVEYIDSINVLDFINCWILSSSLDNSISSEEVLANLNLLKYKNLDQKALKEQNYYPFINIYLADKSFVSTSNDAKMDGTVIKTIEALRYLLFMRKGVIDCANIYKQCKEENIVMNGKLKEYLSSIRAKEDFMDGFRNDFQLISEHAFRTMHIFSKVRDFLTSKGEASFRDSVVVFSYNLHQELIDSTF